MQNSSEICKDLRLELLVLFQNTEDITNVWLNIILESRSRPSFYSSSLYNPVINLFFQTTSLKSDCHDTRKSSITISPPKSSILKYSKIIFPWIAAFNVCIAQGNYLLNRLATEIIFSFRSSCLQQRI